MIDYFNRKKVALKFSDAEIFRQVKLKVCFDEFQVT